MILRIALQNCMLLCDTLPDCPRRSYTVLYACEHSQSVLHGTLLPFKNPLSSPPFEPWSKLVIHSLVALEERPYMIPTDSLKNPLVRSFVDSDEVGSHGASTSRPCRSSSAPKPWAPRSAWHPEAPRSILLIRSLYREYIGIKWSPHETATRL